MSEQLCALPQPPQERLAARTLVLLTLAGMVCAGASSQPLAFALVALTLLATALYLRLNIARVAKSAAGVAAGLTLVTFVGMLVNNAGTPLIALGPVTITTEGFATFCLYTAKLLLMLAWGALLLAATTPTQLAQAIARLLAPLKKLGAPIDELAFILALGLRFVPTLQKDVRTVMDAQQARGGSLEYGSPLKRAKALVAVLVPTFAATIRHAHGLSEALESRAWQAGAPRTVWQQDVMRPRDAVALTLMACAALLLIVIQLGLI
jgi:energy-coupling factor transport system ATP-binding protein